MVGTICLLCNVHYPQAKRWCEYCYEETIALSAPMTLVEYRQLLEEADWAFTYTDDHRTLDSTDAVTMRILEVAKQSEDHLKLFYHFERLKWNEGKNKHD
jgi:hypothetical protein